MNFSRRAFLGTSVAGLIMAKSGLAFAANVVTYTPEVLQTYVNGGQPYMLDFSATWCSTCKAQERVLAALQDENAAYNAIPILRVDWDTYRSGPLVAEMAIPRRSVLVIMRGEAELGRVVAQTSTSAISELFDLAL